jgi:hypothetical protein
MASLNILREKLAAHGWRITRADFPKGSNTQYRWYLKSNKTNTGRYFNTLHEVALFTKTLT